MVWKVGCPELWGTKKTFPTKEILTVAEKTCEKIFLCKDLASNLSLLGTGI